MKKTPQELLDSIKAIEGFLTENEAYFLYKTVYELSENSRIVEIGSYKGLSTAIMSIALRDSGNLSSVIYAIDPFVGSSEHDEVDTYGTFINNLKKVDGLELVEAIRSTSEKANQNWDLSNRIDFLWIDGGHEYEYVSQDLVLWPRMVSDGGVIACHDSAGFKKYGSCMGVRRAVREYMFDILVMSDFGFADSIIAARKRHSITPEQYFAVIRSYYLWWYGGMVRHLILTRLRCIHC